MDQGVFESARPPPTPLGSEMREKVGDFCLWEIKTRGHRAKADKKACAKLFEFGGGFCSLVSLPPGFLITQPAAQILTHALIDPESSDKLFGRNQIDRSRGKGQA